MVLTVISVGGIALVTPESYALLTRTSLCSRFLKRSRLVPFSVSTGLSHAFPVKDLCYICFISPLVARVATRDYVNLKFADSCVRRKCVRAPAVTRTTPLDPWA